MKTADWYYLNRFQIFMRTEFIFEHFEIGFVA